MFEQIKPIVTSHPIATAATKHYYFLLYILYPLSGVVADDKFIFPPLFREIAIENVYIFNRYSKIGYARKTRNTSYENPPISENVAM